MTVAELEKILRSYDPNAPVIVNVRGSDHRFTLEVADVEESYELETPYEIDGVEYDYTDYDDFVERTIKDTAEQESEPNRLHAVADAVKNAKRCPCLTLNGRTW